ncbi:MAG: CotH kinase family protein [Flavobacteriales bacterium]|nr:CotH kinase family protein [Flavobacteriales bacterium]
MRSVLTAILAFFLISHSNGQSLYDHGTIQSINILFSQTNWDYMLDTAKAGSEGYLMADSVYINGFGYDSVGVKYKGNSSYNASQVKNPWHIELDTYKDQDYQGYKDIKLANVAFDPSFVREAVGYKILGNYMDCPKANYANVSVNGNLIGLYTNTESIGKAFVNDRFGSKTNAFFSCSPPDGAGPQTTVPAGPDVSGNGQRELCGWL